MHQCPNEEEAIRFQVPFSPTPKMIASTDPSETIRVTETSEVHELPAKDDEYGQDDGF